MGIFDKKEVVKTEEVKEMGELVLYNTEIYETGVARALNAGKEYLDKMVYVHSRLGDRVMANEFLKKSKTQEDMMNRLSIDRDTECNELQLSTEECKILLLGYFRLELDIEFAISVLEDTRYENIDKDITCYKEDINKIRKEQQAIELFL